MWALRGDDTNETAQVNGQSRLQAVADRLIFWNFFRLRHRDPHQVVSKLDLDIG